MTFRLFHGPKVWGNFVRFHNNLSQQHNSRAHNLPDHPHHPHNGMHLGQIPAVGSNLLPDIRHRINPQHIDPLIGQIEEIIHHLIKHNRIAVIQIPLIGIKGSHHKLLPVRKPGKVPRSCSWEYLRHSLLIHSRQRIVIKKEIPVLIFPLTCPCPLCPLMIL